MQAITHFFSGIFIMALLRVFPIPEWGVVFLVLPLGIVAHFFIDALAKATYHPPDAPSPLLSDKFWVAWHALILVGSIVVAFIFWVPYFWGMLGAFLPDIYDWVMIRGVRAIKKKREGEDYDSEREFMAGKEFHPHVDAYRERYLKWLPDLNHARKGILPEIAIIACCFAGVLLLPFIAL